MQQHMGIHLIHTHTRCNPTSICLRAACELFLRYVTRTPALENEWEAAKQKLTEVLCGGV